MVANLAMWLFYRNLVGSSRTSREGKRREEKGMEEKGMEGEGVV